MNIFDCAFAYDPRGMWYYWKGGCDSTYMIWVIMCTFVSEWNLILYMWKCVMDMLCEMNLNICLYIYIYIYAHVVLHVERCESYMNYESVQLIWLWIYVKCYSMMKVPVVMCRTWTGNIDVSQYYCYLAYVWMIITLLTWLIDMNRYDPMWHVLHDRKKYELDMICIICMKEVE